uniref:Maternal effect embryo arrest 18-2 protein n=1 Tax=Dimocarpus longan TaxID=128017 RepID=M1S179_9ROSI|nr:maternal effect embryo arrest 18-2 protein [Dimocarpus longan]
MADSLLGPSFSCTTITSSPLLNLKSNFQLRPTKSLPMSAVHSHCFSNSNPNPTLPSLLVFSGGTAFNGVVEELKRLTTRVAHVLPVSDDGGSTAEIVRVLGGPAVGDIRSRCLRLSDQSSSEALAVRKLLGHRLPLDPRQAKSEWYSIVEGEHSLWRGVSRPYSETIQAFLVYFQNEILRRPKESFCFSNGSIGNFFFAGARIFFQSLDAAIFLFSRVSDIPSESLVPPVISTNDRLTLGCELLDGTVIRGQNEISHPANGFMEPVKKEMSSVPALPSRIKRVFYMSSEGSNLLHEVNCVIF